MSPDYAHTDGGIDHGFETAIEELVDMIPDAETAAELKNLVPQAINRVRFNAWLERISQYGKGVRK